MTLIIIHCTNKRSRLSNIKITQKFRDQIRVIVLRMETKAAKEDPEEAPALQKNGSPPSLARLFNTVKSEQPMLCFGLLLLLAAEAATQVVPLIVAKAYDAIVNPELNSTEKMADINYYMLISIVIFASGMIVSFFRVCIFNIVGERMVSRLRIKLYSSILSQEIAFFDEEKSGELVSRLGSDTTLLQGVISQSFPEALSNVAKAIASVALTFIISPELAGVSIGTILAIVLVSAPLGISLGKLSKKYQDALGEAQTHSTEAIGAMRTVQSFTGEEKEINQYRHYIGDPDMFPLWWPRATKPANKEDFNPLSTYSIGFQKSIVTSGFFTIIFGGIFGFLYVCLWYGFYLVNDGHITLGELTAFQSYVFNIGLGLGTAANHIAKIFEGVGASGRVFFLLDRIPSIPVPKDSKEKSTPDTFQPTSMDGNITFENVNFAYPSRPDIKVLDGFTLNVSPNTTAALVGSSGSGKSTVISLLQRFYDVQHGKISIDGNELKNLDLQWLRQHIGYVQQEPQLFGRSIRDNLLYGIGGVEETRSITQEQIEAACIDANAHDFISAWPDGYETLVGERGIQLSGGQKQRIAIARALITKCRILLLDEATSALDAESEHLVQEAIDKAVLGRTVIIVAHRLSTIQRASQIVVMNNHKIVDVGTHDYLMKNCERYQDLIKRQNMIQK